MAVEKLIENGNKLRDEQLFEEAIEQYDLALKENPNAFKALVEKSIALQRNKQVDLALDTLGEALKIATQRSNRENLGLVYFRFFTAYQAKADYQTAIKYLNSAKDYSYNEKEIELWFSQVKRKVEKAGLDHFDYDARAIDVSKVEEVKDEEKTIEEQKRELEQKMANKDNLKPTAKNIRLDWFQSNDTVTVSLFVKNLPNDDSLKVNFHKQSISIEFPTSTSSEFQYNIAPLFGDIIPSESSYRVFSTKLELTLQKSSSVKWKELKREESEKPAQSLSEPSSASKVPETVLSYPNSAKNAKDWSKLSLDEEEVDDDKADEHAFFEHLYEKADDDTKRAMMKSYIESNGTSLSTNWNEVSKKRVETVPPDGLEARKW